MIQRYSSRPVQAVLGGVVLAAALGWASTTVASSPGSQAAASGTPAPNLSRHVVQDIERHRAMAAAHTAAAQCLEAGRKEADCQAELQASCKGIAIGRYCGMRHAH